MAQARVDEKRRRAGTGFNGFGDASGRSECFSDGHIHVDVAISGQTTDEAHSLACPRFSHVATDQWLAAGDAQWVVGCIARPTVTAGFPSKNRSCMGLPGREVPRFGEACPRH